MSAGPFHRVWVIGGPASGKSTFARRYADHLGVEPIELDALFWGPGWQPREDAWLDAELDRCLSAPRWVVDGSYPRLVDDFASRADCLVWLDAPFGRSWLRLLRRTLRRLRTGEEMWNGNGESFRSVFGPRSILVYAVRTRREQQDRARHVLAARRAAGTRVRRARGLDPEALADEVYRGGDAGRDH